jgi:glucosamine 6-phosphate synthetase-like amidotransferase/phosphosugar isomerase protein
VCGIAGYIGNSKNPDLSFKTISRLFNKIESRGKDASGFWGVSHFGDILFDKKPIASSLFLKDKPWLDIIFFNPKILMCHAREASKGVGLPQDNRNNHPFTNHDRSIAAIHNGRIPDQVYNELKKEYELVSECDSELFLRMFETDLEVENYTHDRIKTIRNMWRSLKGSHMAVMIGEQHTSKLWVFRNEHRSLWKAHVEELGQIFFVSTKEIWEDATKDMRLKAELSEIETNNVYMFEINSRIIKQEKYSI